MVRYGELFLKSDPVKYHFIGILLRNIRRRWKLPAIPAGSRAPGENLVSGVNPEEIARVVSRVFGVVSVSVCTRVARTRMPCVTRLWPR